MGEGQRTSSEISDWLAQGLKTKFSEEMEMPTKCKENMRIIFQRLKICHVEDGLDVLCCTRWNKGKRQIQERTFWRSALLESLIGGTCPPGTVNFNSCAYNIANVSLKN